jgi:hypothetical protein
MNWKLVRAGSVWLLAVGFALASVSSAAPAPVPPSSAASTTSTAVIANKERHPVQAELVRELKQLERTKHVMEVASAKNPSPHRKAATDHVQSAIDEIKDSDGFRHHLNAAARCAGLDELGWSAHLPQSRSATTISRLTARSRAVPATLKLALLGSIRNRSNYQLRVFC